MPRKRTAEGATKPMTRESYISAKRGGRKLKFFESFPSSSAITDVKIDDEE